MTSNAKDAAKSSAKDAARSSAKDDTNSSARDAAWQQIQVKFPEANFLQSPAWAKMNELIGHEVIFFELAAGWCLGIVKQAKRGRYLEIGGGPLLDWQDEAAVRQAFAEIKRVAKDKKCVFVRLRPQLRMNEQNLRLLAGLGCRKAPMHLYAEHTIMIDLTQSEADLLANMRRQTRYEVRRSAKLGITVKYDNSLELFREFHQVQAETAARQGFVPPDLDTLLAERTAFGDQARIYVAETSDHQPIAYGLVLWSGAEAAYFEAASTDLHRKLPGAYALTWQAMRDLKALGLQRYNLWGIAPPGAKHHRYAGVTTFKTGFGGAKVEFVPAQDIVISKVGYTKDWLIETVRRKARKL